MVAPVLLGTPQTLFLPLSPQDWYGLCFCY